MAKFDDVFEDTQAIFDALIAQSDLERVVKIKILANNKLKEIGKVVKANDLLKHMTDEDVVIILNEMIFEQLTMEQKIIVAEELMAPIHYDFENDKLNIVKPDVVSYSGILRKYNYTTYEVLRESIKTLFKAAENKELDKNTTPTTKL